MSDKKNSSHAGGMALNDIYFVLFRHKWKIITLSTLGFVTAAGIYFFKPPTFQSEADLYIKYVRSETPQGPGAPDSQFRPLDSGLDGVINTEVAILSSFDLAYQVATNIGPAKVVGNPGGPNDSAAANSAAGRIRENLLVDHFPRSPVLKVIFSHSDSTLVQPILQQLIEVYQMRHNQIHDPGLTYDDLALEVGDLKKEMERTEEQLRMAKKEANVNNVEHKKDWYEQFLAQTRQAIMIVSGDLAEHQSRLAKLKPNDKALTPVTATNGAPTNAQADIPKDKISEYQQTLDVITNLKKQYTDMRSIYPEHSNRVLEKKAQIAEQEKVKAKLEQEEPRLVDYVDPSAKGAGNPSSSVASDVSLKQEEAAVESLQRKLKVYQTSFDEMSAASANLDERESAIGELERKLQRQRDNYASYDKELSKAKIAVDLGTAKNANISVTQKPTPPVREQKKTPKMMGIAAAAGIVLGLAWAFLQELYFDHSVKRAKDIEGELGMRLFLSIPDTRRNGFRRAAKAAKRAKELEAGPLVPAGNGNGHMEVAPWDHNHALHTHYEALRDRLITYFEVNNLNHKPKLVAVTGSSKGSGNSTIAAGLAASLSETGDGNVLLIDMNLEQGAAQQFYKGRPHCELDTALEGGTMEKAMIQDNLYVVAGRTNNGDKLSSMLPKRFANLIPKLKASDYDYIIFDMPPISRTGVTQRLAGFMDMMMLVVEAEKTNRDVVKQANTLLTESKAKVSVVLNKTRTYIPARLHQEF